MTGNASRSTWEPRCFGQLSASMRESQYLDAHQSTYKFKIGYSPDGLAYLENLRKAAAKFKLSESFAKIEFDGYTEQTAVAYSEHVRIVFAVIAVESFLRVFNTDHHKLHDNTVGVLETWHDAARFRIATNKTGVRNAFNSLEKSALKNKINAFYDENSDNWLPVAFGIRHLFAHGKTAAPRWLVPHSGSLQRHCLDCIARKCDQIASTISGPVVIRV